MPQNKLFKKSEVLRKPRTPASPLPGQALQGFAEEKNSKLNSNVESNDTPIKKTTYYYKDPLSKTYLAINEVPNKNSTRQAISKVVSLRKTPADQLQGQAELCTKYYYNNLQQNTPSITEFNENKVNNLGIEVTECSICYEQILKQKNKKIISLPCGHIFHISCIGRYKQKKCPCCTIEYNTNIKNFSNILGRNTLGEIILVGKPIATIKDLYNKNYISAIEWSPCGKYIASGSEDGIISIWHINMKNDLEANLICTIFVCGLEIISIKWIKTKDGSDRIIVCTSWFGITIWNPFEIKKKEKKKPTLLSLLSLLSSIISYDTPLTKFSVLGYDHKEVPLFSPDGSRIISMRRNKIWVLDSLSGEYLVALEDNYVPVYPLRKGYISNSMRLLVFSSDGQSIAALLPKQKDSKFRREDSVKVWDVETGKRVINILFSSAPYWSFKLALSPDGKRIVFSNGIEKTVKVFDVESGTNVATFDNDSSLVESLSFSQDGRRLVYSSCSSQVQVWDIDSNTNLLTYDLDNRINSVKFYLDEDHIIIESLSYLDILNIKNDNCVRILIKNINKFLWNPNGSYILSAHKNELEIVYTGDLLLQQSNGKKNDKN
jgi:WD40 repeat protein